MSIANHFAPQLIGLNSLANSQYKSMNALVVFGTPSEQCMGHGICMVLPEGAQGASSCDKYAAFFARDSDHSIHLIVSNIDLSPTIREKQFSCSSFHVKESFPLPKFMLDGLSMKREAAIPKGVYNVQQSRNLLLITMPLEATWDL